MKCTYGIAPSEFAPRCNHISRLTNLHVAYRAQESQQLACRIGLLNQASGATSMVRFNLMMIALVKT